MFYKLWKKRTLEEYKVKRDRILLLEKSVSIMKDEEIQEKFNFFKKKIKNSKEISLLLEKFLVPVFSLVRETIYRKTGLLLFPTQILGGIVLHYGNVAQMNTGEGKTLTAILPICLNSLTGKQIYVMTVNEYLSHRDWKLAKPILDFFGITSGFNSNSFSLEKKKDIYHNSTIIYTTDGELVFDYLRSNLVKRTEDKTVSDNPYFGIKDEVDLVIDNSRNPSTISRRSGESTDDEESYGSATSLANIMVENKDYFVDKKENNVHFSASGIKKAEKFYQIANLFSFNNQKICFLLFNALKAKHLYQDNVDYIIDRKQKKIILIDIATGRPASQRVYGHGIQQAIESKESVSISSNNKNIATITYQNFFRLFKKIAGMTGTGKSEEEEFRQIYGMPVFVIPPYKKLKRIDYPDLIFFDKKSMYQAIIERIERNNQNTKRPILVISPDIKVSEYLSFLLEKRKIKHVKLNAKNHEEEAEVISNAGNLGKITISTPVMGRGVDINPEEKSLDVGGLLVIIIGIWFSKRIEDQCRGRAGRQGQEGASVRYVSLDDELIKNFAPKEKLANLFSKENSKYFSDGPLQGKFFSFLINEPQENLQNAHSASRKSTLEYDLSINQQRQKIYNYRNEILVTIDLEKMFSVSKSKIINKKNNLPVEYLRHRLIEKIDFYWSNYLEALEKVRSLIGISVYLPQEPQEAFFWKTNKLFQKTWKQMHKELKKIILEKTI